VLLFSLPVSYYKIWLASSSHPAHVTMVYIHPLSQFFILLYKADFKKFRLRAGMKVSPVWSLAATLPFFILSKREIS
jgi:hypothetical protein